MIEILVIIAVVRMFTKKATEKGLNKVLWGIIGALSYYVPVIVLGYIVLPEMIINGTLPVSSETDAMVKGLIIVLAAGILCCTIAYQILKRQEDNIIESDIIDGTGTLNE